MRAVVVLKGGAGSGFYGHKGRPGEVGGSVSESSSNSIQSNSYKFKSHFDDLVSRYKIACNFEVTTDIDDIGSIGAYDPDTATIKILDKSIRTQVADNGSMPGGNVRNLSTFGWKFLVSHEYGHAFDFGHALIPGRQASIPSMSEEWRSIVDEYRDAHPFDLRTGEDKFPETIISTYSTSIGYSRFTESFAEAFACYDLRSDWLKTNQPRMYNYIDKLTKELTVTKELSDDVREYYSGKIEVFDGEEMKWIHNPQKKPVVVVLKQLPITDKDKQKLLDLRVELFYDKSDELATKVFTGDLTIGAWEETMRAELRQLHSSAAAITKGGWDQMSSADWGRLGTPLREQYKYLHGFANTIAEQADTISLRAIQARARMYGRAVGGTASLIQAGAVIENLLPWMPCDGSTKCLVNCKCRWELRITKVDKKSGDKTVKAVWRLSPAEHCVDCLDRNGHIEMLVVPKDTVVPKYIGRGV